MSQRLGDLLVKEKVITPEQLEQATKLQKEAHLRLASALVKLGFLSDEDVTNFLSRQYGVPAINLSYFEIDPAVVKLIPYETAKRYQILPLSRVGASLTIAMVDPTNVFAMDDIKFMTGFNIEPVVASESAILEGIEKAYGTSKEEDLDQVMQSISDMDEADVELQADQQELGLADLEKAADEAPIVKLVNLVLTDAVKRGVLTEQKAKEGRARICGSTAPMELRDVQFVIEAASEKIDVKREIFRELAMEAGPKTIVATNTSALPVSALADVTVSPEHVIGLHFFNPVSRMKLVEVVIAKETLEETRDRSLAFVRQIGKLPVIVRDSPGFLVNRVLFPYLLDAAELFEAGLEPDKIDTALVQWGMPMGPLRLIDEIGVDICIDIGNTLEKAYGRRDHVPAVLLWLRDRRMLGRKSGAGFYRYEGKTQTPNELLAQWRRGLHGEPEGAEGPNIPSDLHRDPRLRLNEEDLARRLVLLMVNEAARCVEEKVVDSPEDADYGMILGTGFSPFRGGPLRYAEHLGLNKVVDELERLARTEEKFLPCEILKKHARDGTKFYAD